jgi:mono/diheme cytochrome c family protein
MSLQKRSFWLPLASGALAMAILFALGAAFILRRGFSARDKPGALEAALARYALHASVTPEERALTNPVAQSAQTLAEARDHFADHCANCHANNGSGHTILGDGLNPAPPDLRLAATQSKSDGELYSIIQNGIRMSGMPAFGQPGNNDQSTWKLVLFLRHLPSLTPEEELEMRKANPITPSELKEQQEEDDFLHQDQPKLPPKGYRP